MKITEVIEQQPDQRYFLAEGCAIFALVLRRMLGRGEFYIYADPTDWADKWGQSGYEYTHVVLALDNKIYDVRGARTLADLAQEFAKNPADMRLLGPFAEPDFRRRFVGSSGRKPFYGPTPDTVKDAETIIGGSPARYSIPVSSNATFSNSRLFGWD